MLHKNYLIGIICILLFSALWTGCTAYDDYLKYVEGGEIVYPQKADSVNTFAGRNRILLEWQTLDPRVTEFNVIYGYAGQFDSLKVPAVHSAAYSVDTIRCIIGSLEEASYTFRIVSFDAAGNRSLTVEAAETAYGTTYENGLYNRVLKNRQPGEDGLTLEWYDAGLTETGIELNYHATDGTAKTVITPSGKNISYLPDFDYAFPLSYRTLYKPTETAIDVFSAATAEERIALPAFTIDIVSKFGNGLTVLLKDAYGKFAEFFYLNDAGQPVSAIFPVTAQSFHIPDYGSGPLSYNTLFKFGTDTVRVGPVTYEGTVTDYTTYLTASPAVTYARPGDFDLGGEGVGFHDNDGGSSNYRKNRGDTWSSAVDIESDAGNIGYTNTGEWLMYTVDVQDAGNYEIDWNITANGGGAACHIEVDGVSSEIYSMVNNGDWGAWRYYCEHNSIAPPSFSLTRGKHTVKYYFNGGDHNYNGLRFTYKP